MNWWIFKQKITKPLVLAVQHQSPYTGAQGRKEPKGGGVQRGC